MAVFRSPKANPPSQAARISENRSDRHPRSQTLPTDPALGETPKDPPP
jgi:hypothetical protein